MPDYARNDCECNETSETTTTPLRACDCGVVDSSKETRKRIWKEVGRASSHRTTMLASMVCEASTKATGVGKKHASYARYLAKKKALCCP